VKARAATVTAAIKKSAPGIRHAPFLHHQHEIKPKMPAANILKGRSRGPAQSLSPSTVDA
jgi:hypothetical protein